jgi:hypothetical protein
MSTEHLPVILIELVLVFGGVLLFGWWQLRSVSRDQRLAREAREREEASRRTPDLERSDDGAPAS